MNSWTDEQAQKAVRRFLNGEDSKRYQSIYKDGASADETGGRDSRMRRL